MQAVHKVTLPVDGKDARGWIRFKIISTGHALYRIRIDAFDSVDPSKPVHSFTGLCPANRFTCYLYLSPRVGRVEVHIELIRGKSDDLDVNFRRIPLIEYVWHALRKGTLHRIKQVLTRFFHPPDPFIIAFAFPIPSPEPYSLWIKKHEQALARPYLSNGATQTREYPPISILLPVCDPHPNHLQEAIDSVRAQTFPNWTLSIADDASRNSGIRQILEKYAREDPRIFLQYSAQRGGISATTNIAFAQSSAPFVTCLDHDDLLAPMAIEACSLHFAANPGCRLLFSDEDVIDASGKRYSPIFKPRRFSRELFYSANYLNHLTTHRADTVRQVGGWRSAFDGAQDYDLILRCLETMSESSIHHIPLVLYHWRAVIGSTALDIGYKPYAIEAGRRALAAHFERIGTDAEVTSFSGSNYRIRRMLPRPLPKVSIVIPFRDRGELLERCVSSIISKTSYENFEIILVNNGSTDRATLDLLERLKSSPEIRILNDDRAFNYSQLNNFGASAADGEYLCLLNNDTEIITEDWLEEMLSFASVPEIGCVGAMLLYPNRTVQHAGVILGIGGVAGHAFIGCSEDNRGALGRLQLASNYSAVTGACLMLRRSIFFEVGGLDEVELAVAFNDIDLCLKVQSRGYRNVVTPFARLFHLESATRGSDLQPDKAARLIRETRTMRERYGDLLQNDPYYSPNLSLKDGQFSLKLD